MKTITTKFLALAATAVLTCGLLSHQASAVPITGDIDFAGQVALNTTSLLSATQVDAWLSSVVTAVSGSFATPAFGIVPFGSAVTHMPPWTFGLLVGGPETALWSVGGFTFDLTSSLVTNRTAFNITVQGTGMISGNGFDPTVGAWVWSANRADGGMSSSFGFTANTAAVPEGGSALALLGIALVGVEVLRRKLASA